ncbi:MAG: hypothetical protein AAFY48_16355 [Bacteroidota bacterium]
MQRLLFLGLFFMSFVFLQCETKQQETTGETGEASTAPTTEQNVTPPTTTETVTSPYPSITQEKMMHLYNNCDYIDFVFYNLKFSMSQNKQDAIRNTLGGVSTTPAKVIASCKPVGRVFFQVDGKNAEEADLFFGNSCLYYLFLENGTYAYGNQLSEGGYSFYQRIFQQGAAQAAAAGAQ